jgi:hypothetical protein
MSYLANRNVTLYTASTIKTYGVSNPQATAAANPSNGTFSNWITAKSSLTNLKKIAVSATGQYQVAILSGALWYSSDSGVTWTQPAAAGLPSTVTVSCGSVSTDGLYITLGTTGDYLYVSTDRGATFNNPAPGVTPYSWLPLQGNTTDVYGNTITVTGAPGYAGRGPIPSLANALYLNNASTGGTATQYVRGAWAGSPNFTVSFWFYTASVSATNDQTLFSAYSSICRISLTSSGSLNFLIPTGPSNAVGYATPSRVMPSTWYYVTMIFQSNATCSFYLNNNLLGTYTNVGGISPSFPTTNYTLGCYDNDVTFAYGGYIADFRLYNTAITYTAVPVLAPFAWLKFENNTTDSMGAVTANVTGTLAYVPGQIGASAVYLNNTTNGAGGTATTYIRGSVWSTPTTGFTVTGAFNVQSYAASNNQIIFSTGGTASSNAVFLYIAPTTNTIAAQVPSAVTITSNVVAALNTWYTFALIVQPSGGTCTLLLNGTAYTGTSSATTSSTAFFGLGTYDATATTNAFNGYIDDIKIYNFVSSIPLSTSRNWTSLAVSGNGQYQLAGTDDGAVLSSTNYGVSWLYQPTASSAGSIRNLSLSHTGQYQITSAQKWVQPNQTGLAAATWSQGGVSWAVSESSYFAGTSSYYAFDNTPANVYATASNFDTNGNYGTTYSTIVQSGVGTVYGEYLQLRSSVPLVLQTYSIACGSWAVQYPKTYLIVGSTDGSTWYPIQNVSITTNPFTGSSLKLSPSTQLIVNYTGTQAIQGNQAGSCSTTAYATSTQPFTYFRLIMKTIWPTGFGASACEIGEFYTNFLAQNIYTPQQTGLSTATWQVNGVRYTASESSEYSSSFTHFIAFNNAADGGWGSAVKYNTTSGAVTVSGATSTTILGGVGAVLGEYLQLQTSVPMVMQSYSFASGGNAAQVPATYYIVGSTDGSNWYPIQYMTMSVNAFTAINTNAKTWLLTNYTGTQYLVANQTGSGTSTAYATSTSAYTYFRIVINAVWGTNNGSAQLGEWYINFLGGQTYSTNYGSTYTTIPTVYSPSGMSISPSGQYSIGLNNLPVTARMTLDTSGVDGVGTLAAPTTVGTVTYSASVYKTGAGSAYFGNTAGASSGLSYLNYALPSSMANIASCTVSCWVYPTAFATNTSPLALNNGGTNAGNQFYIDSSGNANLYWFTTTTAIGTSILSNKTISLNTWSHLLFTFSAGTFILYINGVAYGTAVSSGSMCSTGSTTITNLTVGAGYSASNGYAGYVDDVRLYPYALSPDQVYALYNSPNSQCLSLTNNYLANITTTPTSTYFLAGNTAPLVDSASSINGQTMVIINSATTGNNVWYSTNYGQTWTALAITVTAPLVSCSVSYDGTYISVASSTTVYTLNNGVVNTTGVALGNQAGLTAQGNNAIAIGNQAGKAYQTPNSIVLNATGSALTSNSQGFYVAPIANALTASATANPTPLSYAVVGYGTDSQIVQSSHSFQNSQSTVYGEWIQYQLATATPITGYTLVPRLPQTSRYPISWILAGSTDGLNWWQLDAQVNTVGWGTYNLAYKSVTYSYYRIIFTQIKGQYTDIGNWILLNGSPIFGAYTNYAAQGIIYNLLQYNGTTVCTTTFSWDNSGVVNALGIVADGGSNGTFPSAYLPTTNSNQNSNYFLGFETRNTGAAYEYNSSYIATQGTYTVVNQSQFNALNLAGPLTTTGLVGIGSTTPQYTLDVVGTAQVNGPLGAADNGIAANSPVYATFGQTWVLQTAMSTNLAWGGTACSATGQYQTVASGYNLASGVIWYSSNYGQTWAQASITASLFNYMAMSGTGQYQLIGVNSSNGALYLSTNYGATWTATGTTAGATLPWTSAAVSYTGQYLYATVYTGSIYSSSNFGASFSATSASSLGWNSICCSSSGQYVTSVVYNGSIYYSNNYGVTWTSSGVASTTWNCCTMSQSGQYQYATTGNNGIWTSTNYGLTWVKTSAPSLTWISITCSGTGQYLMSTVASSSGFIYYSTNYGATWSITQATVANWSGVSMSQSGQYVVACSNIGAVFTSQLSNVGLLTNGSVGIGITTPAATLHTRGSLLLEDVNTVMFPPAPLTSANTSLTGAYPGIYVVTASTSAYGNVGYYAFTRSSSFWQLSTITSSTTTTVSGTSYTGEWLQISMPYQVTLSSYQIYGSSFNYATGWVIAGSNDGSTWYLIDNKTGQNTTTLQTFPVYPSVGYYIYRFIYTASAGSNPVLQTWNLIGTPRMMKSSQGVTTIAPNVGIGTSPTVTLDINSSVTAANAGGLGVCYIRRTWGNNDFTTNQHASHLQIFGTGVKCMAFGVLDNGTGIIQMKEAGTGYQSLALNPQSGNVGIGLTNPGSTLQVNGSLAKSSGTFDIPHPLYPDTDKRLVHSFIEGPRCDLIYRGTVQLVGGTASLDVNKACTHNPDGAMDDGTFEALCANPQFFFQNMTGFDRVIGSISGCTLTIQCENAQSTDTISWMVVAERKDSFIKKWERTDADGFLMTQYESVAAAPAVETPAEAPAVPAETPAEPVTEPVTPSS